MLSRTVVDALRTLCLLTGADFEQIPYLLDGAYLVVDRHEIDLLVFAVNHERRCAFALADVLNLKLFDMRVIVACVFIICFEIL